MFGKAIFILRIKHGITKIGNDCGIDDSDNINLA